MLSDDNGSILVLLIIIIPILLLLISVIGYYSLSEVYQTNYTENKLKAYYLARSGADAVSAYILNGNDVSSIIGRTFSYIDSNSDYANNIDEIIIEDAGGGTIKIISTATVENITENVTVELTPGSSSTFTEFDKAVFSEELIDMTGSGTVNGDIGINSNADSSILLDGDAVISGDIYVGPEADINGAVFYPDWYQLESNIYNLEDRREYLLPEFPDFPEELPQRGDYIAPWWPEPEPIESSGWYNSITVESHLDIETNGQDIIIRANELTCNGDGEINIHGTGKVYFYIEENFELNGSGRVNTSGDADPADVFMYYSGSETLYFDGDNKFVGSLYALNANLELSGGGGIMGHIITGGNEVLIDGGFYGYVKAVLAPNADITLTGGGEINGSVVGKNIEISGGSLVNYDNGLNDNLPEEISGDNSGDYVRIWK